MDFPEILYGKILETLINGNLTKLLSYLSFQLFFSYCGLIAPDVGSSLGAVIVHVIMKARFGEFTFFLGSDEAAAFSTVNDSSERKGVNLRFCPLTFTKDVLNPVKFFFAYHGFMFSWMKLSVVPDHSRVERISEDLVELTSEKGPSTASFESSHFKVPVLISNLYDLAQAVVFSKHQLPHFLKERKSFGIFDNIFFHIASIL